MCGIVGIISRNNRNVVPDIMEGLEKLEYRGYDSAGIAIITSSNAADNDKLKDDDEAGKVELKRCRAAGKLINLQNKLNQNPLFGSIGIGHTRWATHGKASEYNAHPMMTKDVALVHNGIIENAAEIKAMLKERGYEFSSDTDTEAAAIFLQMKIDEGCSPRDSFRQMLRTVKGTYAFLAIFRDQPDTIFCARNRSPIVIGFGRDICVGSDAGSIPKDCDSVVYLDDRDYVECSSSGAVFFNSEFNIIEKEHHPVIDGIVNSGKGSYSHYMIKEIMEQPSAIRKTIMHNIIDLSFLQGAERILILACGSSYHAGMVGKYWLEKHLKVPTHVEIASEYRHRFPVIENNTLVIVITQSGETIDTLEAMEYVRRNGVNPKVTAITNVANSAISRAADFVFHTKAGAEIGVASTKAFTAQLTILAAMAFCSNPDLLEQLHNLPQICEGTLAIQEDIDKLAEKIRHSSSALYLGRDSLYPIALEGALKLKEISYIHAEGFAAGEMKHGPIALIDEKMPVICLCPSGDMFDKTFSNIQIAQARGKNIIVFTDAQGEDRFSDEIYKVIMPPVCQELVPILYSIPLQLLAYKVTVLNGIDADKPRNLAKSVTVE